jgi:hypothetical protein
MFVKWRKFLVEVIIVNVTRKLVLCEGRKTNGRGERWGGHIACMSQLRSS